MTRSSLVMSPLVGNGGASRSVMDALNRMPDIEIVISSIEMTRKCISGHVTMGGAW